MVLVRLADWLPHVIILVDRGREIHDNWYSHLRSKHSNMVSYP